MIGWIMFSFYAIGEEHLVGILEDNRISIYFIADTAFLLSSCAMLIHVLASIRNRKTLMSTATFAAIMLLLFAFVISWRYGNIARSKIGYFYMIPEGEYVDYPRRTRNKFPKN
jgi:hypothetical membrane protein